MRFVLMLLSVGLVIFLYVKRANQATKPPEAVKEEFVAGFNAIFVMNCSASEAARQRYCECFLQKMLQAKALEPTMEDLQKQQVKMRAFQATELGKQAEAHCSDGV